MSNFNSEQLQQIYKKNNMNVEGYFSLLILTGLSLIYPNFKKYNLFLINTAKVNSQLTASTQTALHCAPLKSSVDLESSSKLTSNLFIFLE